VAYVVLDTDVSSRSIKRQLAGPLAARLTGEADEQCGHIPATARKSRRAGSPVLDARRIFRECLVARGVRLC